MRHARLLVPGLLLLVNVVGCTVVGARYAPHVSNTLALREAGLVKVRVGEFRKDPRAKRDVDRVSARGMTVTSAYGNYTTYLREAFASEFDHADLLDADAPVRIDGTLLRNELSGNLDLGYALIEADVTVTRDGAVAYRGVKTARLDWKSAFPAEVAVPRAIANYQAGVQRLIAAYVADPEFVAALKRH